MTRPASRTWVQWVTETEGGVATAIVLGVLLSGLLLGGVIPPDDSIPSPYDLVSNLIGWTYFMAWSVSFWPQVVVNYQRKSVVGLSFDFVSLNLTGFACYAAFNCALFFNSSIRDEYKQQYGSLPAVRANDVAFALHAVILTLVTAVQMFIYEGGGQKVSWLARGFIVCLLSSIIIYGSVVGAEYGKNDQLTWLGWVEYLSYVKLAISLTKYCPQAFLNWRRKSTSGWTIHNVLLDFLGGTLSLGQLLMDCAVTGDWSGIAGDPVKFGLGFTSMVFDIIFMTQHYLLYPEKGGEAGEGERERDLVRNRHGEDEEGEEKALIME